jgi:hypothetical protein
MALRPRVPPSARAFTAPFSCAFVAAWVFVNAGCTAEVDGVKLPGKASGGAAGSTGAATGAGASGATGGASAGAGGASAGASTTGGSAGKSSSGGSAGTGGDAPAAGPAQPGFARLTRAEYAATVREALGVEPDLSLIPVDGRVGAYTSNAETSPDPVHPYLLAAEDLALAAIPAELPSCSGSEAADCLETNYRAPIERLYRRTLSDAELAAAVAMHAELEAAGLSADDATRAVLTRALLDPEFLFRAAPLGASEDEQGRRVAQHLSYLLWDAPPDAELDAAATGPAAELGARLRDQTARFTSDARAVPIVARFLAQWLRVNTDLKLEDPEFEDSSVYRELLAFAEDALAQDLSVQSLVLGTRGFVARDNFEAYGLDELPGDAEVEAVTWDADSPRRGLLGEELFLDATRHPDPSRRAIFRGRLIRTSFLCDDIPAPDAALLALNEEVTDRTVDTRCAGCHLLMDPVGHAFAGLDLDHEGDVPPAELLEHPEVAGTYEDLPALLEAVGQSQAFASCFSRHFLSFFLEQPLAASDPAWVAELASAIEDGAGLRAVIELSVEALATRTIEATPWCEGP